MFFRFRKFTFIAFFIISFSLIANRSNAQCSGLGSYNYGTYDPTCPGITTVGCMIGGAYVSVVVIAGNNYVFSTCTGTWDSEITLFDAAGTTVLGYDNDGCAPMSSLTYTATFTGYINVQVNLFPCLEQDTMCIDLDIECIGNPLPPSPTGDCANAINVCTNLDFSVQASGFGYVYEIPPLGTVGNPEYMAYDSILSPWGSDHYGCLMSGELNTTWMIINVLTTGNLEFTFGANGTQSGFYDWIMYPYYPYTCDSIPGGNFPPVRCNWNYQPFGGTGIASVIPPGGDSANFEPPLPVIAGQQYIVCMSNWSAVFTLVPLQFNGSSTVSCTPLPIELLTFKGQRQPEGHNLLTWVTATETNNDHFLIQHSIDCKNWNNVETVAGAGNSNTARHYQIPHYQPQQTLNYYRLIQIDTDGHQVISSIISVDNSKADFKILKVTNLLGQDINQESNGWQLIYYSDGSVQKNLKQ